MGIGYRIHMLSESFSGSEAVSVCVLRLPLGPLLTYLPTLKQKGMVLVEANKNSSNLQLLKYSNWIPSVHILVIIFKRIQAKKTLWHK